MVEETKKFDLNKAPVDLVPPTFIESVATVLGFGAIKYGRDNWRNGLEYGRTYAAALRHLYAWWQGEDFDKESGLHHLDHAITNLMFLKEWSNTGRGTDNRFKHAQLPPTE